MLKEKVLKVLNDQINAEYYSAYLYLAMSAQAGAMGFKGISNWLFIQAKEEMSHGTHMLQYILERGAVPSFSDIKISYIKYENIIGIYEQVLSHEQCVTELINNIASIALQENDYATYNFIMWYVNEQIEEESTSSDILSKVKLIGDEKSLLYTLDTEFASRTYSDPFATTAN
jgi:ferritin